MKLLLFDNNRLGLLKGESVVDVTSAVAPLDPERSALAAQEMMEHVIENWAQLKPQLEDMFTQLHGVPLASVRVRPPLPRPHNALCAFSNYQDRDGASPGPLDFFHKSATSIIGHGDTVEIPDITDAAVFQPEPEFAYLIGKEAKDVSEAQALDHVFGYTNFVDISARGIPNRRTTFLPKALDTWAPMGPVIATKDEIENPQNVRVRLWLNGEQRQDYNTSWMNHSIATQIAWLSKHITLKPGDVISCGVHHVGLSPINDRDVVEMECEGLERLRFSVKSHGPVKTAHWRPPGVKD